MSHELAVGARDAVLTEGGRTLARELFGAEEGSLQAALQRLLHGRANAPITARIAASHVRMLLLPWLPQLTRPERWLSLATSRFEQTFGEPAEGWVLRVADDLPPRSRLAAAIPETLLHPLREYAKPRSVRIVLLDALGTLLQSEPAFSGCAAQVERDSACLLMLWRGELKRIRVRRFDAAEELAAAARSEWVAARGSESDAAGVKPTVAVLGTEDAAATLCAAIGCSRVADLSPRGVRVQ